MPRYSQFKYGKAKYGKYDLVISSSIPLQSIRNYRIKSIDSNKNESRPITHISEMINSVDGPAKVRIRTDSGSWVYNDIAIIPGSPLKVRVSAVCKQEQSSWVESVTGTLKE